MLEPDFNILEPTEEPPPPSPIPQRGWVRRVLLFLSSPRLGLLTLVLIVTMAVFAFRLYQLQIVQAEYWQEQAEEQRGRLVRLPAPRGIIYARDGTPLVRNVPSFQVTVIPALLPEDDLERESALRRLAALLGMP